MKVVTTANTSLTLITFTTYSYRVCTAVTVVISYQSISFTVIMQLAFSLGMKIDPASNTRCWSTLYLDTTLMARTRNNVFTLMSSRTEPLRSTLMSTTVCWISQIQIISNMSHTATSTCNSCQ